MNTIEEYYREALAARLLALGTARQAILDQAPDATASLRRISHALRGSGGTYGYPEISAAARTVEEAPDSHLATMSEKLMDVIRGILATAAPRRVTLLIVEDDPDMAHLLQHTLQGANRTILVAATATGAEEVLQNHEVSLIVLDLMLPDMDGRHLLVRLRERPDTAALPVVVLSANETELARAECLAVGADAYFVKPFVAGAFTDAIRTLLQRVGDARRESRVDALTGLPNRPAFREAFSQALSLAARTGMPVSVGIFDLDHFKEINDSYGHAAGDRVLCRVAETMPVTLRQSDVLARWGGDEFVVLFPNTRRGGAVRAFEAAMEALARQRFESPTGKPFGVTFSAGVVEVRPGTSIEEAVIAADQILYRAKAAGRNRVMDAERLPPPSTRRVLLVEDDGMVAAHLLRDLTRDGFEVVHFSSGATALAAVHEGGFSVVILDVVMPHMGGFEVLRRLRSLPAFARVPIVMLTAMGRVEDVARAIDLGADDYLVKPVSPAELLTRIRRSLVRYETPVEPPGAHDPGPEKSSANRGKIAIRPPTGVRDLIPHYLQNRANDVTILRRALEERNFEILRRTGHSMKGSGGGYGFRGLTEIGDRIEAAALREDVVTVQSCVGELVDYLERVEVVS